MRRPVDSYIKRLPEGVLVDPDIDLSRYNKFWVSKRGDVITQSECTIGGKRVRATYRLHCIVMGTTDPRLEVDHINHDKLDNRRSNLRICNHAENGKNLSLKRNNTSGFPGVHFDKTRLKWVARIKVDYREKHLGRFGTIEEAIGARLFGESLYFGDYAPNVRGS